MSWSATRLCSIASSTGATTGYCGVERQSRYRAFALDQTSSQYIPRDSSPKTSASCRMYDLLFVADSDAHCTFEVVCSFMCCSSQGAAAAAAVLSHGLLYKHFTKHPLRHFGAADSPAMLSAGRMAARQQCTSSAVRHIAACVWQLRAAARAANSPPCQPAAMDLKSARLWRAGHNELLLAL